MDRFHYNSDDKPGSAIISFKEARKLAAEYGTPLLVCKLKELEVNYNKLKRLVPNADLYYAVKANPLPEILGTLVRLGSKFDVASVNEIRMCFEAGAKAEDLLYANPVKPPESIKFAYDNNVRCFTYDSFGEVEKMAKHAPGSQVILRLAVKDLGSVCKFSTKFGAQEKYALNLLSKAKEKGLQPIGLSFHVGSQCMHPENYLLAIDLCRKIFDKAKKKGLELDTLDIGGGIPIEYTTDVYSFEDLSEMLNKKINETFPEGVKIIMEPGRPMVGDIMTLVTKVIGVNKRRSRECLYLDDGVYNSLSEKIFGHCEYRLVSDNRGSLVRYRVFGPTCDSMDVITNNAYLPELKEGDIVLVLNAGAYTNSASTHFNGFDPAKIFFI
jgi:ornithine decarboxylase